MSTDESRTAEVVLVRGERIAGRLPAVPVDTPWWPDVAPVVAAVRERHGVEIVVLRLLDTERDRPHGGRVTYLAEIDAPVAAEPWDGLLDDHPLRQPYARPGGPRADLAWARAVLDRAGIAIDGPPQQVRTWNLSSLWRIPTRQGNVWLKVVPAFFAHEGAVLDALAGEAVPRVLGREGTRVLLAEVPGDDLHAATRTQLLAMVTLLVGLQSGSAACQRVAGLPDWRAPALAVALADTVERTAPELDRATVGALRGFVADLPRRFAEIADCGLADTLIHGDFHPGNVRGGAALTILDWADSGVGHPLLDMPAFVERVPEDFAAEVRARWLRLWRDAVPGSDPERAAALIAPVAAARQAAIYRRFIEAIEPSERVYHRGDPAVWLRRAARIIDAETSLL